MNNIKENLKTWLQSQQETLEKIIGDAAVRFYKEHQSISNFQYDLKQCHIESYNLSKDKDLCYDRLNTAFSYSLWYHPRRVNTFLSFFVNTIVDLPDERLQVFDLGAGTGAIQWVLGLIFAGLKRLGKTPPQITVINIDTSPIMLSYNKDYLWREFVKHYPELDKNFIVQYEVNSWNNESGLIITNPVLAVSYLFDDSDNQADVTKDFIEIINTHKPNTVLLLTSEKKADKFFHQLKSDFINLKYNPLYINSDLLFNKNLARLNEIRRNLSVRLGISELSRSTSWQDISHKGIVFQKIQPTFVLNRGMSQVDIYNPPITIRREVKLNPKQLSAALNNNKPTSIVGPAGCGKSIVITEKIKNIVEAAEYSPYLKILVTTFNKGLIEKLSEWLKDILKAEKFTFKYDVGYKGAVEKSSHFTFTDSSHTNIRLLHFDMLPKLLGGIKYEGLVNLPQHYNLLNEIIEKIKIEENITDKRYDNILNHNFLFEEYHRVIYGLQVGIAKGEENYLTVSRVGRGRNPQMDRNSDRRKIVWKCLVEYARRMHRDKIQSFTLRRQYFYSALKSKTIVCNYDYILVDEFQDCTEADFEIFYSMIKNPNNLTIAGDLAQSIHLGVAARLPRTENMSKWEHHRLDGSYRLPVRISECIKKLSQSIVTLFGKAAGVTAITPYKASPPGARPVVVYGNSCSELAELVAEVFSVYKVYNLNKVTILERSNYLQSELSRRGILAETDTILSLKGLEKECVLWHTEISLEFENEALEFAYTILTRTSCILIIAITDYTQNVYKKVLGLLDEERLIFWNKATKDKFQSLCEYIEVETIIDEE